MSKVVEKLSSLTDIVPEGITFSLSGYESITGTWSMDFHSMDEFAFLPFTDQLTYTVHAATFLSDIEQNIERFIETYEKFKAAR